MVEKFLLNLEYECTRQSIAIPWDDIAHRFHPGATAAGVQQHFARLRSVMAAEGHLIPPKVPTKKDRGPVDSTIRGYLRRDIDEDGNVVVRPVKYAEPLEHPTFNRADAHDIGAYGTNGDNDTPENCEPSSASKATRSRRKTRVPIKYEDFNESESEFETESDLDAHERVEVRSDEPDLDDDDGTLQSPPLDERPIRGGDDTELERRALQLYTRNRNPKMFTNDPRPVHFCHGEWLTFPQVCAKAITLEEAYGYPDVECGFIITHHARLGAPPTLGHFQSSNMDYPVTSYPHTYRPVGGAVNTMPSRLNNLGTRSSNNVNTMPLRLNHLGTRSSNNVNTMSPRLNSLDTSSNNNQPAPVTPKGNTHANVGLPGPLNNAGSSAGSGRGFNSDFSSPTEFNPGGTMSSPTDYKSPADHNTSVQWANVDNDRWPVDDFPAWMLHHNVRDNTHAGMSSGAGNNQAFNTGDYLHHMNYMTAGQVGSTAGRNSGSSVGTNNVGSFSGPSSSPAIKHRASPQDDTSPELLSTSDLRPSHESVIEDLNFDEDFNHFELIGHPSDDNDATGLSYKSEQ
ncbi:hypothetical protein CONLIGDRAFT_431549 [Coniochaeta ligniaria NRRL 30616]|uniref:Myb-like domain-containing protein n=1 Tax=Coniochaeta ligniaria NRRL 30616 TaxID=1408157 RepID=A0A1J7IJJ4_9PEZI|nr:hypothetical protein CONLIGDRAFT_431549 [Coniochaeta ligniaria NRRL 30616]